MNTHEYSVRIVGPVSVACCGAQFVGAMRVGATPVGARHVGAVRVGAMRVGSTLLRATLLRALIVGSTLVGPTALHAQTSLPKSDSRGLMLGAHLVGNKMSSSNLTSHNEIASGAVVGYGITRWLMVYAGLDLGTTSIAVDQVSEPDGDPLLHAGPPATTTPARSATRLTQTFRAADYSVKHFDVGLRLTWSSAQRAWAPFVNIAATERRADGGSAERAPSEKHSVRGRATTIGAGVQYFVDRRFALEGGVQYARGKFNKVRQYGETVTFDNVPQNETTRLSVGIRYYPHIRR